MNNYIRDVKYRIELMKDEISKKEHDLHANQYSKATVIKKRNALSEARMELLYFEDSITTYNTLGGNYDKSI